MEAAVSCDEEVGGFGVGIGAVFVLACMLLRRVWLELCGRSWQVLFDPSAMECMRKALEQGE